MGKGVTVLGLLQSILKVNLETRDFLKSRFPHELVLKPGVVSTGDQLIDNGDGTVTDPVAKLMWVKRPHTDLPVQFRNRMNLTARREACAGLNFAKHKDWRQPTRKELLTRSDITRFNPAVNTDMFPDIKPEWYGTSDTYAGDKSYCWCVSFYAGIVDDHDEGNDYYVWPVRSSQ